MSGSGAIGDGYREMGSNIVPVDIGSWNATSVEAGAEHACARLSIMALVILWYVGGGNSIGQLGLGNTNTIGDDSGDLVGGELPHVDLPERGDIASIALGHGPYMRTLE